MHLNNPFALLWLGIIPIYWYWKYARGAPVPSIAFSSVRLLQKQDRNVGRVYNVLVDVCMSLALMFFVIALARPQGKGGVVSLHNEGVDIVLTVDISGSMLTVDTIPTEFPRVSSFGRIFVQDPRKQLLASNRMSIAKRVISSYVERQAFNRLGIVAFGSYSYTLIPLTLDKDMVLRTLSNMQVAFSDPVSQGTAIGMGLGTAVNRLKNSEAKSKVIILLTDGANNAGKIDPLTAARVAAQKDIRVYTIGMGSSAAQQPSLLLPLPNLQSYQLVSTSQAQNVSYNPRTLVQIAEATGGQFFQADTEASLRQIYNAIDNLEKTDIQTKRRQLYDEKYPWFVRLGLLFLGLHVLLSTLVLRLP